MAKLKIKLDTRTTRQKSDGTFALVFNLSHKRKTRLIQTGYSLRSEEWDEMNNKVVGLKDAKFMNTKLDLMFRKAELFVKQYAVEIDNMEIGELRVKLETEMLSSNKTSDHAKATRNTRVLNKESFTETLAAKVARLRIANKHGYADAHETAHNRLTTYSNRSELLFTDIDVDFLKAFEAWCYGNGNKVLTGLK